MGCPVTRKENNDDGLEAAAAHALKIARDCVGGDPCGIEHLQLHEWLTELIQARAGLHRYGLRIKLLEARLGRVCGVCIGQEDGAIKEELGLK